MTLSDPRQALAEGSSLVNYLLGVAALTQLIDVLAQDTHRRSAQPAGDFVHLLLGVAGLGTSIEQLADVVPPDGDAPPTELRRWLR